MFTDDSCDSPGALLGSGAMGGGLVKYAQVRGSSVEIRLSELAQPSETYFADSYAAEMIDRHCYFRFGKLDIRRQNLFSVLELVATREDVRNIAKTFETSRNVAGASSTKFDELLDAALSARKLSSAQPDASFGSRIIEATKQHSVPISLAVVAFSDDAAVLTFHRVPFATHVVTEVPVIPVVRVDTTLPILASYCRDVRAFAGRE